MAVDPIPRGFHTVTPYLIVRDAARAIDFYRDAFGATEIMRMPGPGGKLMHAEIRIGDSVVMLADEFPEMDVLGPESRGGCTSSILLYVPEVDSAYARALSAGAKELRPLQNQFWGDRMGTVTDPFGHNWSLASHVEDVTEEEMQRRFAALMSQRTDCAES